jgi:nucleoside-diphosphate kinase
MIWQRTLFMIKPGMIERGLVGRIITVLEEMGVVIERLEMRQITREVAEQFYIVHKDKPFYQPLVDYIISGRVVVMVVAGEDIIARMRNVMGDTEPAKAAPGTIRARYGESLRRNAVHGSDSPESAFREIGVMFPDMIT